MKLSMSMFLVVGLVLAGCGTPPQSVAPSIIKVIAKVPVITPLPQTAATQNKGDLEISITPTSYSATRTTNTTRVNSEPTFQEGVLLGMMPAADRARMSIFVETQSPAMLVDPDRLSFTVKINNKMPRVFRGAGTVVQFNAAGQTQDVDQTGYGEMLKAIVPPHCLGHQYFAVAFETKRGWRHHTSN